MVKLGIHKGFKIPRRKLLAGSSPATSTRVCEVGKQDYKLIITKHKESPLAVKCATPVEKSILKYRWHFWKDGRAADYTGLENRQPERVREFKSHSFRQGEKYERQRKN